MGRMEQRRPYCGRRNRNQEGMLAAAGICLLLGLLFLALPGVRFSGYLFLLLAVCCLIWLILHRWAEISRIGRWCKWIFLVGISCILVLLLTMETMVLRERSGDDPETPAAAVIVLGAGVHGETPSLSLRSRLSAAADYLKDHPRVPAVLSGGKGAGEDISEAEAMRRELVAQGIGEERLWLEDRSANTLENFRFSREILRQHGVDSAATVAVVTNDFHLFRAKLIARRIGMAEPVGIPAELPWWLAGNYYVREAFASVKTLVFDKGDN